MSQQRQHILLSYFKTLSVRPAGIWTRDLPLSRLVPIQLFVKQMYFPKCKHYIKRYKQQKWTSKNC